MKQTVKWLAAALIALGLNQAVWADDVSDFRENLQAAAQGLAQAQYSLGAMYYKAACAKTLCSLKNGLARRVKTETKTAATMTNA